MNLKKSILTGLGAVLISCSTPSFSQTPAILDSISHYAKEIQKK